MADWGVLRRVGWSGFVGRGERRGGRSFGTIISKHILQVNEIRVLSGKTK